MQTLFEVVKKLPHVVKVDYLKPNELSGMYVETDLLKLNTTEKVLDDIVTMFGERSENYHFGIKKQQELVPETQGKFYCIYVESLEEFKKRNGKG